MTNNLTEQVYRGRIYSIIKRSANFNNVCNLFVDRIDKGNFISVAHIHRAYPFLGEVPYE